MDKKWQFLSLHVSYLPIQVLKTSLRVWVSQLCQIETDIKQTLIVYCTFKFLRTFYWFSAVGKKKSAATRCSNHILPVSIYLGSTSLTLYDLELKIRESVTKPPISGPNTLELTVLACVVTTNNRVRYRWSTGCYSKGIRAGWRHFRSCCRSFFCQSWPLVCKGLKIQSQPTNI